MKNRTHAALGMMLVTAIAVLAFGGCVSGSGGDGRSVARAGDLPQWYLNPQDVYPSETFLTSIGSGDSRRDAEQQALAGLSQIFEAEISVDSRTSERYSELMTAQGSVSENEVRLAQDTSVRSNQTLLNVQYGEAAVDEMGRVHVIAYIERLPTGRVYADLIEKNGDQVESFLQEAASSDDLVREYAYTSAAAVVSSTNEVLRDQLRIIAPGFGEIVSLPYDPDEVLQRRADLASQMQTSVDVDGDETDRIAGVVRAALSEERFPLGASDPVFRVTGQMRIADGEVNEDFQSVRWTLTLDFAGPDGDTLVTFDQQSRASGVSREAAVSFAYNDMEEAVAQGFVGAIRRYFDGVVLDS